MTIYAFWISTRELENGDMEISRLTNAGEVEASVVVPVQERMDLAERLMRSEQAERADVCRSDPDTLDPSLLVHNG